MTLKIEIEMENAAFEDGAGGAVEVARILRKWSDKLEREGMSKSYTGEVARFLDVNGNKVGKAEVVE